MSYIVEKIIKPVSEIILDYPISPEIKNQIEIDRTSIKKILSGQDDRKILIVGPCSAWPNHAVISYAQKLKEISDKYSDKIKIMMRVYTQKPRTSLGWTGPVNQPDPFKIPDIEKGIIYCRKMMIEILKIGLPIADEALFTHNEGYFSDLLSWVAIGARSAEDQEHRIYASMISNPVGIKNPTSGDLKIAINSIIAAQNPHVFLLNGKQIKTSGNNYSHLILRGGNSKPNIDLDNLIKTTNLIKNSKINFPSLIVDVSHDNSINLDTQKKDYSKQPEILLEVLENMNQNPDLLNYIKGFMLESFILDGAQNLNDAQSQIGLNLNGLSITDACINLEKTEQLIKNLYENL